MTETPEITEKSRKNEIYDAYLNVLEKLKAQEEPDPKKEKEKQTQQEVIQKASSQTEESIINNIASLKLEFSSSMDKLEKALTHEYKKLKDVQLSIKYERENLESVYSISEEANTLAALIQTQKQKKQEFEEYMETTRLQWDREKQAQEQEIKERKEKADKERKAEEEEYQYTVRLARKKEEAEYNAQRAEQEKELENRRKEFEQEIAERSREIAAREQELAELREKADKFPGELENAVKETEKNVTQTLNYQYEHEKTLREKEVDSEIRLKDQTIENLKGKIKEMEDYIKQLNNKVESSENHVKEITIKSIESSSKGGFPERLLQAEEVRQHHSRE